MSTILTAAEVEAMRERAEAAPVGPRVWRTDVPALVASHEALRQQLEDAELARDQRLLTAFVDRLEQRLCACQECDGNAIVIVLAPKVRIHARMGRKARSNDRLTTSRHHAPQATNHARIAGGRGGVSA